LNAKEYIFQTDLSGT